MMQRYIEINEHIILFHGNGDKRDIYLVLHHKNKKESVESSKRLNILKNILKLREKWFIAQNFCFRRLRVEWLLRKKQHNSVFFSISANIGNAISLKLMCPFFA